VDPYGWTPSDPNTADPYVVLTGIAAQRLWAGSGSGIAAGKRHSLAVKNDGTVWAWGSNFYGELGDGSTTDRTTPAPVTGP
jgi:alpha-tubulin suppressor-like RCC1 family protein